ncbi:hypothetical protein D3C85_621690 [compost metagenome]
MRQYLRRSRIRSVDLSEGCDGRENSSTQRSKRRSRHSLESWTIVPPYTGKAEYLHAIVDLEDIEFQSLEQDLCAEGNVILKAFIHYICYDDDFFLSRLTDEFLPPDDIGRAAMAIDVWFSIHLDKFRDVFAIVKRFAPMRVNNVEIKQRSALLEFTYEEFIDAT